MRTLHWVTTALVAVVLIVFAVGNRQAVTVWPLGDDTPVPLFAVVLVSLALGFLIGEIVAWIGGRRWRREARHRAQRIAALERELAATQAQLKPATLPGTAPTGGTLADGPRAPVDTAAH